MIRNCQLIDFYILFNLSGSEFILFTGRLHNIQYNALQYSLIL